jgi:flagellar biosynthetic protein FliQ
MTTGDVIALLQRTLWTMLAVGGPIVLATMVVGLVISVFQAATQINEATLTFVPKLAVVGAILMIAGPGMLQQLIDFTRYIFATAAAAAH